MSEIRIKSISIKNYRSFWNEKQTFTFPGIDYKKPVSIVWYNNSWKTNLINAILYWIGENYISEKTFELKDLYNLKYENNIEIVTELDGSIYWTVEKYGKSYDQTIKWEYKITTWIKDLEIESQINKSFFWANKHYNIFYINFHNIKEQIVTKKTSWWNLNSFLAKHINKLVETDKLMNSRKEVFNKEIEESTKKVLEWVEDSKSELYKFIQNIKKNYSQNLRNNACEIEFWLPDYEDIFLQMMFKIWLNWEKENLVPIDHFWDWYISMFIMSVIQAIAESNTDDKCLFLFEEPESFLHENHQEYFYKMVLCKLAENHQVIYTTHSDKMLDIFDTKWLIRIEFDENKWTQLKYNKANEKFEPILPELVTLENYNSYIKYIEPNLNKILFSKKVILVEWPNDLLVYYKLIEKKIFENIKENETILDKQKFCETYLNFKNISIIPHHWKATALFLTQLCQHLWLEYFLINDLDFNDENLIESLCKYNSEEEMKAWTEWTSESDSTKKWMITTNWKLINKAWKENIHFNIDKLETLIWYNSSDKNSYKIFEIINKNDFLITNKLFPENLEIFIELKEKQIVEENYKQEISIEEVPF